MTRRPAAIEEIRNTRHPLSTTPPGATPVAARRAIRRVLAVYVSTTALTLAPLPFAPDPARAGPARNEPPLDWADTYDGGAQSPDLGTAALCDAGGNLIVGGESADGVDGSDMLIRKLSRASGETMWSRRVPSFDTNDMALSGLAFDPFGNVLVGGYVRGCVG